MQTFKMKLQKSSSSIPDYIENYFQQPSMQYQHLSGAGPIFLLEKRLRSYFNKRFAVTFCNATSALHVLCLAMELNDKEIITSPVNWGGSIAPFLLQRNKVRFAAIEPDSLNLCVDDLSSALSQKTKAILSVDYNGTPANSKALKNFCLENNLLYISDSAQSMGAYRDKKPSGFYADAVVLSFSPGKSFYAGEGGAIVTDNELIYEKILWYSQHPSRQKTVFGISSYNEFTPINGRMNPFSAIYLNDTFQISRKALQRHQSLYFSLLNELQQMNLIEPLRGITSQRASTFFNFSVQLKTPVTQQQLNDYLNERKHPFLAALSNINIIPYDQSFKKQFRGKFSCTEKLKSQKSSIHFHHRITLCYSSSNPK